MRILDYDVDASNHKTTTKENCASVNTILPRPSNKTMVLHAYKKEDNTQFPKNYIYSTVPPRSERWHPTQKPIDLLRYLVLTYTNEGDTVLDNCMGSGTTAIACIKERRHFIGFELNKEYYDKACKRIKAEQAQLTLF
jgi:site-specific DNA-methyltransferase (adenine-specific)